MIGCRLRQGLAVALIGWGSVAVSCSKNETTAPAETAASCTKGSTRTTIGDLHVSYSKNGRLGAAGVNRRGPPGIVTIEPKSGHSGTLVIKILWILAIDAEDAVVLQGRRPGPDGRAVRWRIEDPSGEATTISASSMEAPTIPFLRVMDGYSQVPSNFEVPENGCYSFTARSASLERPVRTRLWIEVR